MKSNYLQHTLAVFILGVLPTSAHYLVGQERKQTSTGNDAPGTQTADTLILPGSPEVLKIDVMAPSEIRVGEAYENQILVSNLSKNLALQNVRLVQQAQDGFAIESSKLQKASGSKQQDKQQDKAGNESPNRRIAGEWTISMLELGESRAIDVTAVSDTEGNAESCIMLRAFTPVLCMSTRFVAPQLELVKQTPSKASLCGPIEFEYIIKNTGSGSTAPGVTEEQPTEEEKSLPGLR